MKQTSNKNVFLTVALLATLIAIGCHAYLTQHFYAVKFGTLTGTSFCNVSATFNCDTVTASKFASFLGIPVALWGLVTNVILLFLLSVTRWNLTQDPEKTSRYTFLMASLVLLGSVIMGLISATAMTAYCLVCIGTYVLSIITFVGALKGAENLSARNLTEDIKDIFVTDRWILGSLICIPVFAFVANLMYMESQGFGDLQKMTQDKVRSWIPSPEQKFDIAKGLVLQTGTEPAVMTIVEFADFLCPHCKDAAPPIHAFVKAHPDVKLVFKPFPLDPTCNPAMQGGGGDGVRCGLAASVMCSEQIAKKGWEAHDFVFENQMEMYKLQLIDKMLEQIATKVGIPLEDLKKCVNDPATKEMISSMAKEGGDAQIQGTPTVFVNGKLLSGGQSKPILEEVYRTIKQ
ncbi:fused vitamin K epoxide reductase/thioredoxin [Bdellovibrio sp. ZAP7]|uniref:vitamin K epoxide reductase/DsbA family protein n=1 Tax=Bdellovibrio sp. ZAP7 TaxID=2231053 RepID=UPI0011583498|nr:DsbA family protein [Bdellovibrio sp. ZAP7]QDK45437.1 fused vitamin K epoxide reductase/thioredoxin [Bdellovibrio sp. ZAP7]